jgi:serine/threonine-protein kinase
MKKTLFPVIRNIFVVSTTLISLSLPLFLKPPVSLAEEGKQAVVFAPPSNVRATPGGRILCTVNTSTNINIYGNEREWYRTDVCGNLGYIHKSQIRFFNNPQVSSFPVNCVVININTGQLAVRESPGGNPIAGLNNNDTVRFLSGEYPWYYVQVLSGPNIQVDGKRGWVNANYLECSWN